MYIYIYIWEREHHAIGIEGIVCVTVCDLGDMFTGDWKFKQLGGDKKRFQCDQVI